MGERGGGRCADRHRTRRRDRRPGPAPHAARPGRRHDGRHRRRSPPRGRRRAGRAMRGVVATSMPPTSSPVPSWPRRRPREVETRARALYARAVADTIRCTPPALAHAPATSSARAPPSPSCAGVIAGPPDALLRTGYTVSFHGGAVDEAIAPIERGLALRRRPDRSRAVVLTYLADVLDSAGRMTDAEAACREALGIGEACRDQRVIGYACWAARGSPPTRAITPAPWRGSTRPCATSRPLAGRGERCGVLPRRGRHAPVAR